jgi:alanine racemase
MKQPRQSAFHTRRDAWLQVNLSAFEHNLAQIQACTPKGVSLMAVIKADAYGHGAAMLAPVCQSMGVAMIGVASVDEALQIKEVAPRMPVLVMGPTPAWALADAVAADIALAVFSPEQLGWVTAAAEGAQKTAIVHLKVDTGMHRIGFDLSQVSAAVEAIDQSPWLQLDGVFTHLADAANDNILAEQKRRWQQTLGGIAPERLAAIPYTHIASSSSLMTLDADNARSLAGLGNVVRVGLNCFGYGATLPDLNLKPVMAIQARIAHVHALPPGEGVSYGHTYHNQTQAVQQIATLPLGYADGIPRRLSNRIHVLVGGVRCPQVDQLLVDISAVSTASVGEVVTVMGGAEAGAETLKEWAEILSTIEYELMCGLRVRLPRTFIRL